MQEQQVVIENLETENTQLKQDNADMKKALEQLMKRVENLENK